LPLFRTTSSFTEGPLCQSCSIYVMAVGFMKGNLSCITLYKCSWLGHFWLQQTFSGPHYFISGSHWFFAYSHWSFSGPHCFISGSH
jgi:hypothetical protein